MNPVESLWNEDDEDTKLRKSLEQTLWGHRRGIASQLLFTREEVAAVLRTKPETVDKMVAKGRIAAIVLDEDEPPLFRPESIIDFLDRVSYETAEARARERIARKNAGGDSEA